MNIGGGLKQGRNGSWRVVTDRAVRITSGAGGRATRVGGCSRDARACRTDALRRVWSALVAWQGERAVCSVHASRLPRRWLRGSADFHRHVANARSGQGSLSSRLRD